MAKHSERSTQSMPVPGLDPKPGTTSSKPQTASLEVQHEWRRQATSKQLERLWHAAELGRNGLLNEVGDERLDEQRELFNEFSKSLLGADAPVMAAHS